MPTDPSILLVVNPTSGRGRGRRTAEGLTARLQAQGRTVVLQETKQRGDAERIVRAMLADPKRRCGCVVACGGDGEGKKGTNNHCGQSLSEPHTLTLIFGRLGWGARSMNKWLKAD